MSNKTCFSIRDSDRAPTRLLRQAKLLRQVATRAPTAPPGSSQKDFESPICRRLTKVAGAGFDPVSDDLVAIESLVRWPQPEP